MVNSFIAGLLALVWLPAYPAAVSDTVTLTGYLRIVDNQIGIFGSGIAFVCYYKGMELTSTNVGSIVFFLKPILGSIYAAIILSERPSPGFIAGALLILAGSAVMIYGKERHRSGA
jgi:drug/metabolite transporter (DMT)-like permease